MDAAVTSVLLACTLTRITEDPLRGGGWMSSVIATAAIRGAHGYVDQARKALSEAVETFGPDRKCRKDVGLECVERRKAQHGIGPPLVAKRGAFFGAHTAPT